MHRAFITQADVESYETAERAKQIRSDQREAEMATHANDPRILPQENRGELTPEQTTFPRDMTRELGPNEASALASKYRGHVPAEMDFDELSEGSNLPHRDDKEGISTRSRDAARKAGYYQAGIDAFSSDAYMGKPSPIDRKASAQGTRRMSDGTPYTLTHGGGEPGTWGKPLTGSNKHLAYWRDPTSREALANLAGHGPEQATPGDYFTLEIPRQFLVMLARIHDIQVKRGHIEDDGRGEMLRETAKRVPDGTVTVDLYSPSDVLNIAQGLPKRYQKGEFGQLMKDIATHAKLTK